MKTYLPQMAKALLAGGIAVVGSLVVAYTDGVATTAEWLAAAGAGLVAVGGVWRIPNADAPAGTVEATPLTEGAPQ